MQKFDVLLLPRPWRRDSVNQILRVMRVTAFLLFVCFTHVSASVFSQTITLSGKEIPLKKVFAEIKEQTGYVFFYNKGALDNTQPVSFSVHNMPLKDLLDIVLKDQPLTYTISPKTVF